MMPQELTGAGVEDIETRAERVMVAVSQADSIMPVILHRKDGLRPSDGSNGGIGKASRRIGKWTRRLPSALSGSLAVEYEHGHHFLFAPVAIGFGSMLWFAAPRDIALWPCAVALVVFLAACLKARHGAARLLLAGLCLVLAGMVLAGLETRRRATVILDSPVTTTITGVVERGETVGTGVRYLVHMTETSGPNLRRSPRLASIVARGRHTPIENGVVLTGKARLSPPSGPALPGLNDFAFSAYFDGIGAVGHFYGAPQPGPPAIATDGLTEQAERWLFGLRRQIGDRIRSVAPGDGGAFAAAIVTDERRAISNETVEALRVSGLAHIVAISGLNMALAAGILFVGLRTLLAFSPGLAQAIPVKKIAAAGALATVSGYYLISGFGVSAQRAYIMMAVLLVAVLVDRPSISLRNVALSALIIIAWTPSEILGPSFQMSFAATAALVAGYGSWARLAQTRIREPLPFRHPVVIAMVGSSKFIAGIALTSLIGSLATAMFSIEHFHRMATYGLAANLAAMPIISFVVMPAGVAAMLLMPFGLDSPFITIMAQALDWVIAIARHVAGWGGDIALGQQHPWFLPVGVTGSLLLTLLRTPLRLAGLPFVLAALVLFSTHSPPVSDLMISEDGTLVGASAAGGFAINRSRPPAFIYDQWRRARTLPDAIPPIMISDGGVAAKSKEDDARLSNDAVSEARRAMRAAGQGRFTCQSRAWCAIMSPQGVLVVVVEDGRYSGAACDVGGLVIAPRARFETCRSGTPLLNGATLRKTGAIEIVFAGSANHQAWQITVANSGGDAGSTRPWSIHRQYDWRRDVYDATLPEWLVRRDHAPIPNGDQAEDPFSSSHYDAQPPMWPQNAAGGGSSDNDE